MNVCLRREKPSLKRSLRITAFVYLFVCWEEIVVHAYVADVNTAQNVFFYYLQNWKTIDANYEKLPNFVGN